MGMYTLLLLVMLLPQGRQDSTLVFVSRFLLVFSLAFSSTGSDYFEKSDADYISEVLKALKPIPPGWSQNTSFYQWNGIACSQPSSNSDPQVNAITLPSRSLSGELPESLNSLSQLTHLDLHNNSLSGPIPSLAGLTLLETVFLDGNNFASIPDDCFLGLKALQTLNLSYNPIRTGWSFPTELVQSRWQGNDPCEKENNWSCIDCEGGEIVTVNFGQKNYSGTISPAFSKLTSLRNLTLSGNNLTGRIPQSLTSLCQLKLLDVSNNNLIGQVPNFSPKVKLNTKGNVNLVGFSRGAGDAPPPLSGHRELLSHVLIVGILIISVLLCSSLVICLLQMLHQTKT